MTLVDRLRALWARPKTELLFVLGMSLQSFTSFFNAAHNDYFGWPQRAVQIGNALVGLGALGWVIALFGAYAWGRWFLILFCLSATIMAPLAMTVFGGAPQIQAAGGGLLTAFVCAWILYYGIRRLDAALTQAQWSALVADHDIAAAEFIAAIRAIPASRWNERPSPEGWSAAEITEHLARTYGHFAAEARGKNSLRRRVGFVKRTMINLLSKPKLLRGEAFPRARAPRELRPAGGLPTPEDGITMFKTAGDSCIRDLGVIADRRPYKRFIHPYFGAIPLYQLVQFASHHIRHHRRQLPS